MNIILYSVVALCCVIGVRWLREALALRQKAKQMGKLLVGVLHGDSGRRELLNAVVYDKLVRKTEERASRGGDLHDRLIETLNDYNWVIGGLERAKVQVNAMNRDMVLAGLEVIYAIGSRAEVPLLDTIAPRWAQEPTVSRRLMETVQHLETNDTLELTS